MEIEGDCCAETAYVSNLTFVASGVLELNLDEAAHIVHQFKHVTFLDVSPGDTKVEHLCHIHVLFEAGAGRVLSHLVAAEVAGNTSLASKGDEVWAATVSILQVPVLVAPHLSRLPHARLRLVDDEGDSFTLGQHSQIFVEFGRGADHIDRGDWFNDNSGNILAGRTALLNK